MASPVIGTLIRHAPLKGSVDGSHNLASGLEFCFVPGQGDRELSRHYPATRAAGAIANSATRFGVSQSTSSGTTRYTFTGVPDAGFIGGLTILFVGRTTVATNYGFIASKRTTANASSRNTPFQLYFQYVGSPTNRLRLDCSRGSATSTDRIYFGEPSGGFLADRDYIVVLVLPALLQGTAQMYVDGVSVTTTTAGSGNGSPTGSSEAVTLGGRTNDNLNSGVVTNILAFWNRQLSAGEAAALYADPFCFLKY